MNAALRSAESQNVTEVVKNQQDLFMAAAAYAEAHEDITEG